MTAQMMLGDFAPAFNPELGQYHTPPHIAERMVAWAGCFPGTRVLEPSAGGGNIVAACLAAGHSVTAVEIDPAWCTVLRERFEGQPVDIINADFMGLDPMDMTRCCDIAIMNPDLNKSRGPKHVAHALEFCPRAISVLRAQDFHTDVSCNELWGKHRLSCEAKFRGRPVWSSGDGAKSDFSVADVVVRRSGMRHRPTEWWDS